MRRIQPVYLQVSRKVNQQKPIATCLYISRYQQVSPVSLTFGVQLTNGFEAIELASGYNRWAADKE